MLLGYFVTAPNLIGHASRVSTDYQLSSTANDLCPYLEARNYSLIIGHSMSGPTVLNLFPLLPRSHPTAIVLVDPTIKLAAEAIYPLEARIADLCINIKPAEAYGAENPLWTREDTIYRELGTRLCSSDAVHGVLGVRSLPSMPGGRVLIVATAKPTLGPFRLL